MRFGAKGLMSTLMRVRISSDAPRCTVQFGALDPRCTMVQVHGDPNEPSLGAGAAGAPCVTLEEAGDAGLQMERVQLSRRSPAARDRGGRHYVELEQAEEANLTSGCQHLGEHFAVGGRGTEAVLCSRPTR